MVFEGIASDFTSSVEKTLGRREGSTLTLSSQMKTSESVRLVATNQKSNRVFSYVQLLYLLLRKSKVCYRDWGMRLNRKREL